MMKKQSAVRIWPLLLAMMLVLVSCGEFNPAATQPGHSHESGETDTEPVVTDEEGNVDEDPFTVTMTYEGKVFVPSDENPISVQWYDGYSLHTAPIGSDGVARIGGLDGDYGITLTAVPDGFTYNPTIYTATNRQRNVEIELYRLVETTGLGDDPYRAIKLRSTGVYCIELTSAKQEIHFEFYPSESGTYAVESWMNTTDNTVNPLLNYYGANIAYKTLLETVDDGGVCGSYTKNFKKIVEIADEHIGSSGQVAFGFGLKATSKEDKFPIKVYFAITLNGEFALEHTESVLMVPQEILVQQPDYSSSKYEFVGAEFAETANGVTANVFDSDRYKLWPKDEGGDNYYHLYDETAYPETHGYGPILYAKISSPCRFMEMAFSALEYAGNKALTVSNGTENYKLFIEGYSMLNYYTLSPTNPNGKPPYFCTTDCPCRESGTCGSVNITGEVGACIEGCEHCHPGCRNIPKEAIGHAGYADYCNSDGCYAVTEELKDFLQKYSINQLLFFDGNGFVETNPSVSVYATEEDQWLFACGYYKEK